MAWFQTAATLALGFAAAIRSLPDPTLPLGLLVAIVFGVVGTRSLQQEEGIGAHLAGLLAHAVLLAPVLVVLAGGRRDLIAVLVPAGVLGLAANQLMSRHRATGALVAGFLITLLAVALHDTPPALRTPPPVFLIDTAVAIGVCGFAQPGHASDRSPGAEVHAGMSRLVQGLAAATVLLLITSMFLPYSIGGAMADALTGRY